MPEMLQSRQRRGNKHVEFVLSQVEQITDLLHTPFAASTNCAAALSVLAAVRRRPQLPRQMHLVQRDLAHLGLAGLYVSA